MDLQQLIDFLSNSCPNVRQIRRMNYTHRVIRDAANIIFGDDKTSNCLSILNIIRRNTSKIQQKIEYARSIQNTVCNSHIPGTNNYDVNLTDELVFENTSATVCQKEESECDISNSFENSFMNKTIDVSDANVPVDAHIQFLYDKPDLRDVILPKGSKNIYPKFVRGKQTKFSCPVFEGTFNISISEMNSVWNNESRQLAPGYYNFILKEKILTVNNTCLLTIKSKNMLKNGFNIYAYCGHVRCKTFILKCKGKDMLVVSVYSSSLDFSHGEQLTRHVKGVERILLSNRLEQHSALKIRLQDIKSLSTHFHSDKNLHKVKSDDVYRRIKSEKSSINDYDPDDVLDLIKMQKLNKHYIYRVSIPLNVIIFCKEQLDFIRYYSKKESAKPNLYLDATGSVVRKPHGYECRRILYYAGVLETATNRTAPVLEMISSKHDTATILCWLNHFKYYCLRNQLTWPVFNSVTTDFSLAILNATCEAWNCMHLIEYINKMYDKVNDDSMEIGNLVIIKFCSAHIVKLICRDVNKHFIENRTQTLLKEIIMALFDMSNFNEISNHIGNIFIITNTEFESTYLTECKNQLVFSATHSNIGIDSQNELITDHEVDCFEKRPTIQSNKFYLYFTEILNIKANEIINETTKPNPFYNPAFAKHFLHHYIPYLPLWTSLHHTKRQSNSLVEGWFGIVKNNILGRVLYRKCSRFIREVRKYTINEYRENKYTIKRKRCAVKRKATYHIDEETWSKRQKSVHTYFKKQKLQHLQKLTSKAPRKVQNNEINDIYKGVPQANTVKQLSKDYVISKFQKEKLYFSSYDLLNIHKEPRDMWLDNFIIDYCLRIFCNGTDFEPIMAQDSLNPVLLNKMRTHKKNNFIIPVIENMHWMMLIIDVTNGFIYFFDPNSRNNSHARGSHFINKMKQLLDKNIKLKDQTYPTQTDSHNCGVFILYYAETIIKNNKFDPLFDPSLYRNYLKYTVVQNSENFKYACLYCGEDGGELKCDVCKRYCHSVCVNSVVPVKYVCEKCG